MEIAGLTFETQGVEETLALGRKIGALLRPGDILVLAGDLGAGKTWLSKGIAQGLGVAQEVDSPAFDIIHEYRGRLPLYHMDFYRLDALSHVDEQWLDEYLFGQGVCLLEWGDKFIDQLAPSYLKVEIRQAGAPDARALRLSPVGEGYAPLLAALEGMWKHILVLNSSSDIGGVGLVRDGQLVSALVRPMPSTWLSDLLPAVQLLLREAGLRPPDIDLFALVAGPGAWTGIRIGVATVKTLAYALDRPVVAVSALEALAYGLRWSARPAYPLIDAGRGRLYFAGYRCDGPTPQLVAAPRLATFDELAEELAALEAGALLLGDGARVYGEALRARLGDSILIEPPLLGQIGLAHVAQAALDSFARRGPDDTASLAPLYLNE